MMKKSLNPFCLVTIVICNKNMHKLVFPFVLFILFHLQLFAAPLEFENPQTISKQNIEGFLKRFTQEPHPMGSPAQKKLAQDLRDSLSKFGLKASLQEFKALTPPYKEKHLKSKKLQTVVGYNVIGELIGNKGCAVILGGHYDTKYFATKRFIGANDGGSSTALLLELARYESLLQKNSSSLNKIGFNSCSLYFVFFDGEESFLRNWDDGYNIYRVQDNLYGSREFVKKYIDYTTQTIDHEVISLVAVLDMVGHKKQNLFITRRSNVDFAKQLIKIAQNTVISTSEIYIDDDHAPFLKYRLPVLHIIDWTNLDEWHTEKDNLDIISSAEITEFGNDLANFLEKGG